MVTESACTQAPSALPGARPRSVAPSGAPGAARPPRGCLSVRTAPVPLRPTRATPLPGRRGEGPRRDPPGLCSQPTTSVADEIATASRPRHSPRRALPGVPAPSPGLAASGCERPHLRPAEALGPPPRAIWIQLAAGRAGRHGRSLGKPPRIAVPDFSLVAPTREGPGIRWSGFRSRHRIS